MYHAHIVFIWICFVTASIWIRWFRSSTSAQHSNWQTSTQKRIIHRRQMDTTDTTGEHHDSHHIYAMQLVSFSCGCDSFFSSMSKRAGDSVAASASAKQKPVRCTGLIASALIDKYADMWTITQYFHQNIKLEATPSVKTYVSKILKEWTTRRQEHQALVNWKRLEHQAPVAAEDPSSDKKVHLHPNTDGENYISKFDDPANYKPHSTERARISQSSVEQFMCKIGWISHQSSRFPAQRCDLESIYERLFMAFILAYQGWTNVSQEHKIWHSPCNDK